MGQVEAITSEASKVANLVKAAKGVRSRAVATMFTLALAGLAGDKEEGKRMIREATNEFTAAGNALEEAIKAIEE